MSQKFENLSALVDGESSLSDQVLNAVKEDKELMQKWKNYHLIREGLRRELPDNPNLDITSNVMAALESEPAILAPNNQTVRKPWAAIPLFGGASALLKQGGHMAIAASVAVAVILGVQQVNQPEIEQPFSAAPPILGIQGGLSPVSYEQTRPVSQAADAAEYKHRVRAYLNDHRQQMRFKTLPSESVQGDAQTQQQRDESVLAKPSVQN